MLKKYIDIPDPTKGYVKGNVEVISLKANTMKQNATEEELLYFSLSILNRYDLASRREES